MQKSKSVTMQLQYGRLLPGNYFRLVTTARKVYVRLSPGCSASSARPATNFPSLTRSCRERGCSAGGVLFTKKEFDTAFLFEGLYTSHGISTKPIPTLLQAKARTRIWIHCTSGYIGLKGLVWLVGAYSLCPHAQLTTELQFCPFQTICSLDSCCKSDCE